MIVHLLSLGFLQKRVMKDMYLKSVHYQTETFGGGVPRKR